MKRNIERVLLQGVVILLIIPFVSCSDQGHNNTDEPSELFQEGDFSVDVLDSAEFTPREIDLMGKFQQAFYSDMETFQTYFENKKKGLPVVYPENEYLTEKELEEYIESAKNIKLISSGSYSLKIRKEEDVYSFYSPGKLSFIEGLEYHADSDEFWFNDEFIQFKDSLKVGSSTNAFGEPWEAREYLFEYYSVHKDQITMNNAINARIVNYEVLAGTLLSTNRKFVKVKINDSDHGVINSNLELPIVFK